MPATPAPALHSRARTSTRAGHIMVSAGERELAAVARVPKQARSSLQRCELAPPDGFSFPQLVGRSGPAPSRCWPSLPPSLAAAPPTHCLQTAGGGEGGQRARVAGRRAQPVRGRQGGWASQRGSRAGAGQQQACVGELAGAGSEGRPVGRQHGGRCPFLRGTRCFPPTHQPAQSVEAGPEGDTMKAIAASQADVGAEQQMRDALADGACGGGGQGGRAACRARRRRAGEPGRLPLPSLQQQRGGRLPPARVRGSLCAEGAAPPCGQATPCRPHCSKPRAGAPNASRPSLPAPAAAKYMRERGHAVSPA